MPRGKKGPVPEMKVTEARSIKIIEEDFLSGPPLTELLKKGAREKLDEMLKDDGQVTIEETWLCVDCDFKSPEMSYLAQHILSTGHRDPFKTPEAANGKAEPVIAEQPELFKEPGIVKRWVKVHFDEGFLNEKRKALADLYQTALTVKEDKKSADADFNAQLTHIDEMMRDIARLLASPFTEDEVRCEWRVIDGENARGLFRIDTGECIEKAALTAEDRAAELDEVTAANETDLTDTEFAGLVNDEEIPF